MQAVPVGSRDRHGWVARCVGQVFVAGAEERAGRGTARIARSMDRGRGAQVLRGYRTSECEWAVRSVVRPVREARGVEGYCELIARRLNGSQSSNGSRRLARRRWVVGGCGGSDSVGEKAGLQQLQSAAAAHRRQGAGGQSRPGHNSLAAVFGDAKRRDGETAMYIRMYELQATPRARSRRGSSVDGARSNVELKNGSGE
jgi:hypothetical protein